MRSAGCCVNDVADVEFDKHVKRTANRPVTSGKVSKREALLLGAALALVAFSLVLTTNASTVLYSFAALAIAISYPYAKRYVAMPQAVLGVAFSFGIPMAFAAVQGGPPWSLWPASSAAANVTSVSQAAPILAWVLLLGNLFWVLAYDTEYAMVDRDDDLKIGMKTSAITLGRWDVSAIMLFYALYIVIWLLAVINTAGGATILIVFAVAVAQVLWHYRLIRSRERDGCFAAFRANHWLGFTFFAGIVAAYALA
jgi:4-hydroxybenzoate polyprenyltransferase